MKKSSQTFKMLNSDQKYHIYGRQMSSIIIIQISLVNYKAMSVTSITVLSFFTLWVLEKLVLAFEGDQCTYLEVTQPFKVSKSE